MTIKLVNEYFQQILNVKFLKLGGKDKLSFKETAELFNLDNPSLIAAWQKRYLDEGILRWQPKPKGRPSMKPKELISPTKIKVLIRQRTDKRTRS